MFEIERRESYMNQLGVRPEAGHCQPQTEDNDSNINQLHFG